MRIVVDNSSYHLLNLGDAAMLQVAVRRLQRTFPHAQIQVVTDAPDLLKLYCPGTQPLSARGTWHWSWMPMITPGCLPDPVYHRLLRVGERVRDHWPDAMSQWLQIRAREGQAGDCDAIEAYVDAVTNADLVIATGGGYITDAFPHQTRCVLGTLRMARRAGVPTAIFGQGIGPLNDWMLRKLARDEFAGAGVLSLREKLAGPALLKDMGIGMERITVTGDDAIELAWHERPAELGSDIGVNLRVSGYSEASQRDMEIIRAVLTDTAGRLGAGLVPVPISRYPDEKDLEISLKLIGPDAGQWTEPLFPADSARLAGRCRVVVTGSYHAAVFALSQGASVVAVAKSRYYVDKMAGIAEQFGTGCEVVRADDPAFSRALSQAIQRTWARAEEVRETLLARAEAQIEASRAAHAKVADLVAAEVAA
jgi:polysaccharide pyruvyl transferase WcaK-like protein